MKIVLVGLGSWGEKYAKVLSNLGILSAICDFHSQKIIENEENFSVNYYDSIDRLIESEVFDAAFVESTVSNQVAIITKLLYEKKHVFIEKPTVFDSRDGEKLKELSIKKKVILSCEFENRFNSTIKQIRNFVREKKYGDLVLLELYGESKLSTQTNNGVVFENSVSDIDIANWIFEETPVLVFAKVDLNNDKENFASLMLGYKDNKTAIILSNGFSSNKIKNLRVVCSRGLIFSDLVSRKLKVENENTQILPKEDSILLQIQNFIDAIEGKNDFTVKPNEVVNVIKIAEAALLSSKQGVPIYLDLK